MRWEYTYLRHSVNKVEAISDTLNDLGSMGWEVCGFASADQTIGLNAYTVLLKRPLADLPTPVTIGAAWHPDPTDRHEQRYWDGVRWSEHVSVNGTTSTDFPR